MIKKIRPLFNMRSKLEDIPADWMKYVEPRIVRLEPKHDYNVDRAAAIKEKATGELDCWLWDGGLDKNGQAVMHVTTGQGVRSLRRVKRIVAAMFWELEDRHDVYQKCGFLNCVNPNHLVVTAEHYSHGKRPRQFVHSFWNEAKDIT